MTVLYISLYAKQTIKILIAMSFNFIQTIKTRWNFFTDSTSWDRDKYIFAKQSTNVKLFGNSCLENQ